MLALSIIASLQRKTIVLVHKDFLMTQWRDRIQEFLPNARIGKIQQDTIDVEGKDVVLATVQSVFGAHILKKVFDQFGFAVFDDVVIWERVFFKCMKQSRF